jgi:hypothetical protein
MRKQFCGGIRQNNPAMNRVRRWLWGIAVALAATGLITNWWYTGDPTVSSSDRQAVRMHSFQIVKERAARACHVEGVAFGWLNNEQLRCLYDARLRFCDVLKKEPDQLTINEKRCTFGYPPLKNGDIGELPPRFQARLENAPKDSSGRVPDEIFDQLLQELRAESAAHHNNGKLPARFDQRFEGEN